MISAKHNSLLNRRLLSLLSLILIMFFIGKCTLPDPPLDTWMMGPFVRTDIHQPVIAPDTNSIFFDPMSDQNVKWESMAAFNPAAIVRNDTIFVFYRAEERLGEREIGGHTSRIGLAYSTDGVEFFKQENPVLFPDDDDQKEWEWTGGVEDPRIVETEEGLYVMTYTQWNREVPRLALATSRDLIHWVKHGPLFLHWKNGKYHQRETKSGAIITQLKEDRPVAVKIQDKYWMYIGVPQIRLAFSTDMVQWQPLEDHDGEWISVLNPRPGYFDSWLVEAGPPPLLTDKGIVVIYNAGNSMEIGDPAVPHRTYTAGQALFDGEKPWKLMDRTSNPFLKPELAFEKSGQYPEGTTFAEGMVWYKGTWFLYYGTADSKTGVVKWKPENIKLPY
ncbi:MAG TPA: glycoside hydrolase family 130 protein [Saprospiraceae bacterium]|nr:glycoside hydrolase family 130 protein [Saprospiraceae bacterium]